MSTVNCLHRTCSPQHSIRFWSLATVAVLVLSAALAQFNRAFAAESYTLFESGQVRPLALSDNGKTLYAVNTPDNRLEAFKVTAKGLESLGSVLVGVEPVAVAVRNNSEVWVVNHVSDSVSVVDVSNKNRMRVTRTLLVGDEPSDVVFAGPDRAFITTAHRGQNAPYDPQLTTPGIGRADVWVFDASNLGNSLGGSPINIITLFTDTPRALAVSPDGRKVYAAGFKTGNRTTTVFEMNVTANGGLPGASVMVDSNGDGIAEPHPVNFEGRVQPLTGLIVKYNGQHWTDSLGRFWDDQVKFNLPDKDVFVIDAMANPPVQQAGNAGFYSGVGTVLFNMAVNPVSGKVYVSNTEARNNIRFEGPGTTGGSTVRGHIVESRISVLDSGVTPIHLNKHIDYSSCCAPIPNAENSKSVAFPMGMAVSQNGQNLYVAAFGSDKVAIYNTAALESNSFVPNNADQVTVSGGGPSGLVLDEANGRLYVMTRFDDSISIIDTAARREVGHVAMYNPEPASVRLGRRYQYNAALTSSHGDSACASCHVFGDMDGLAWDLGNPDGTVVTNPGPLAIDHRDFGLPVSPDFEPMKGPMVTQSMRGMANHGPMHWRGDRTGGNDAPTAQPNSGTYDEDAAFKKFNVAFPGLNGRDQPLDATALQEYTNFALQITYPPNPIRALDNSLTPAQQAGRDFFFDQSKVVDTKFHCNGCHIVDRNANAQYGVAKPGFFGTDGKYTFAFQPQFFKVPHLRNLYQKVGMFGMANNGNFLADDPFSTNDPFFGVPNPFMGDQIRGFGMFHDGSADTIFRFHNIIGFLPRPAGAVTPLDPGNPANLPITPQGMQIRRNLEQFVLAFDSNLFPIVGQQITLTRDTAAVVGARIDLLLARAALGECDLIAASDDRGYLYLGNGYFRSDASRDPLISDATLRQQATQGSKGTVTYTCVPPGNGSRLALDRDQDGFYNRDEIVAGTDPADPASHP
jgi:YVTN family beta-propeller protein